MSRILVSPQDLERMGRHGEASYPEECCGFLIGRISGEETVVERVLSVDNARQDSRHNRFLIHPETVLAAHKEARAAGLDVVGYYHSHPDHPARPSEYDREHAWPFYSYVIVAIAKGRPADMTSWVLDDRTNQFVAQPVVGED